MSQEGALGIIFGSIFLIVVIAVLYQKLTGEDLNSKLKCNKCKVISRKGIWDLYNSGLELESPYRQFCPVCEELATFDEVYSESSPLAPKLTIKQQYETNKAIKENNKNGEADRQVQLYLNVQEKKLKKMKEKSIK